MSPKGSQNGSKMESKNAHIFKLFRASVWSSFWHLLGSQNGSNSGHSNMAKTKVRTTCGNAKMMEKLKNNNHFEQICNPGGRQKFNNKNQQRRLENNIKIAYILDAFWDTFGTLWGAKKEAKTDTKTKTKLERQKGGSEGSKRSEKTKGQWCRHPPSMHSILLWH